MREHALEWIDKAEDDFRVAEWVMQAPVGSPSAVGFHCQQCVEKYMKALLVEWQRDFPRTHDLILLANLLAPEVAIAEPMRMHLRQMTTFAVENRYPGFVASIAEARDMLDACRSMRSDFRTRMGLEP